MTDSTTRRARLMALRARRDLALRARALAAAETEAAEAEALTDRIATLLSARAAGHGSATVGALASALWLGTALQTELGRSRDRAEVARAEASAEQARVAAATAALQAYETRADQARQAALTAREARADAARADRPRRG
jgi:hypothetical protein